jgi:Domain of unknown function (DUF4129)
MLRRLCRGAAALPAVLFLAGAPHAEAAGCPPLQYEAALGAASAALRQTPADTAAAQRTVAALLATDQAAASALQPVLDDLGASPPAVDDARLRLSSMAATLRHPPGSVCNVSSQAARSDLHAVYSSPEFRHLDDSTKGGLLTSVVNAIAAALRRGVGALGPLGAILLALVIVGAALLLAWRRWHGAAALRGARVEDPAEWGDDPDAEWRAAERAAQAGQHREAVRRAFRSALLEVAVRGRVHLDAAWTTRELLQRCQASGEVLAALAAAAAVFERAWYSGEVVTGDDWERARDRCLAVRRLAGRAGAAAP